ncbi:hypothetical protein CEUSTIGMA_g2953.t1 [Chlamydomonas eustigma]|uniref:Uncharacterized protein n=1 Tax=Chlamydomonas eustigma TaxID=1157962 RepID=A0A250WYC6_9CHLO|nr:hypothetical protein CEUSTIGMA_g2953.t1 [Chlamydomonas eustigma]|eukprot:GAX75510.1 hypothetical protein CEUSTIGMA_g2953.t1 [Chlamydomonas eustigma]
MMKISPHSASRLSSRLSVGARPLRLAAPRLLRSSTPDQEPVTSAPSRSVQDFQILNPTTEAINGRAAMIGFVAAVVSEAVTHQAVWSQVVGRYVNEELVERPIGAASLGFAMFVVLTTMASLAPKLLEGTEVSGKAFGPFTPNLELVLGRTAQMGFLGLILVETLKGSSLL